MTIEKQHDVLVVDLGLPDEDGLSLICGCDNSGYALRYSSFQQGVRWMIACEGSNRVATIT